MQVFIRLVVEMYVMRGYAVLQCLLWAVTVTGSLNVTGELFGGLNNTSRHLITAVPISISVTTTGYVSGYADCGIYSFVVPPEWSSFSIAANLDPYIDVDLMLFPTIRSSCEAFTNCGPPYAGCGDIAHADVAASGVAVSMSVGGIYGGQVS
jgi:hypothetical protein